MSTATTSKMKVTREDLNPCTIKLDIVCSADQVNAGFNKAIKTLSKKVRIPGFRPGTAPKKMVEELINPNDLYNNAAEEIVRVAFKEALEKEKLTPENQPSVDLTKLEKDPPACEFTIKVPLAPQVELADYKGLSVEKTAVNVTDEEVDRQVEELRKRGGKKQEVSGRGIQEGDVAVVNIKPDGQEGDGRNFMIIAGQTFPALDGAIMGMAAEEIKSADLDFPSSFQEKDWANNKYHCHITIRSVSAVQMPELDDAFAQSLQVKDVKELKERVREGIERAKDQIATEMMNEKMLDDLLTRSTVHVADTTWEAVANRRLGEINAELQQKGATLEDFAKQSGMTLEEFVAAQQQEAKVHVQRAVIIEKIFTGEGMKITDEDANNHFLQIAQENQIKQEELSAFAQKFGPQLRDEVIFRSMYSKVLKFLADNAKVTEVAEGAAPKAKAKAKAKDDSAEAPKKAPAAKTKSKTKE